MLLISYDVTTLISQMRVSYDLNVYYGKYNRRKIASLASEMSKISTVVYGDQDPL